MSVNVYSFNVISTATSIQSCAVTPLTKLFNALADLQNLSSAATQIMQDANAMTNLFNVPSYPTIIQDIINKATQLATNLPADLNELTVVAPQQIAQMPTCANNIAQTTSQQLNNILSNVQNCVQSG